MKAIIAISLISLINSLVWYSFFQKGSLQDRWEYEQLAANLIEGNGFSVQKVAPYEKTIRRVPAYPVFVSFFYKLFGMYNDKSIYIAQAVLFVIISISVYYLAVMVNAPPSAAMLAGVLTATNPGLGGFTMELMSEILFTFLMLMFSIFLVRAVKYSRIRCYLTAGLFAGFASLCRPTAQLIPVFMLAVFGVAFFIPGLKKLFDGKVRSILQGLLALWISCSVVVLPWMINNYKNFGKFALTSQVGEVLFQNTALLSDNKVFIGNLLASVSESLARKYDPDFSRYRQWRRIKEMMTESVNDSKPPVDTGKGWGVNWYSGKNYLTVEKIWLDKSVEFIKESPIRYFIKVAVSAIDSHSNILVPQVMSRDDVSPTARVFILITKIFMFVLVVSSLFSLKKYYKNNLLLFLGLVALYNIVSFLPITTGSRHVIVNLPVYSLMTALFWTKGGAAVGSKESKEIIRRNKDKDRLAG